MSRELQVELERRVCAEFPRESCGTLLGRQSESGVQVLRVLEGANLSTENRGEHFELDPAHLVRAELEASEAGLEIVGVWHSHPNQPAVPSEADREGAWREWLTLIASVRVAGDVELRCWRLEGEGFREQPIVA